MKIIIVCIIAGLGAGISTGFAGLSAAVFITPMLVTFLNVPTFEAVGIALASDVLASAVSAYTYAENKNIELKKGFPLMLSVLIFTLVGSGVAFFISSGEAGNSVLGYWSIIASVLLGVRFIFKPYQKEGNKTENLSASKKLVLTIMIGAFIGFICGFQGAGGGLMLLFALTLVMGFDFKPAVGTSVFIMTFTALIGAFCHFAVNGIPDVTVLAICVISTTVFAKTGAVIANRVSQITLKRIIGVLLTVSGAVMLVVKAAGI